MKMDEKKFQLNCEIVRDLLPLYHDGVVSESTKKVVEEHLETCKECTEEYEKLCQELTTAGKELPTTGQQFADMMKKIKMKRIFLTAVIALASCGLVIGGGYVLTREPLIPINGEEVIVNRAYRYETEDGSKLFLWLSTPIYKGGWWSNLEYVEEVEEGVCQFDYKRKIPVITGKVENKRVDEIWTQELEEGENCTEIRLGDRVIWTEEENGEQPIPDYVYVYEEMETGIENAGVLSVQDEMIGIEYEDGKKILWDMDGNVIREEK